MARDASRAPALERAEAASRGGAGRSCVPSTPFLPESLPLIRVIPVTPR